MGKLLVKFFRSTYWWLHILLILGSVATLMPFILMLATSLKTPAEVLTTTPVLLPQAWRWENYVDAVNQIPFLRFYWNTIFVTVCRVVGQLLFASMAAYAFARLRFPGRDVLFLAVLAVMMVPGQVTLVPNYIILKNLGWLNSYTGLIVPSLFTAFGTFLLRQFFRTIPQDIEDAAILDGCNPFQVYSKIALPLAGPALGALGLLITLWSWNDFLWPLIITSSTDMQMLSVGLAYFQGQYITNYTVMMAAATLASLPMFIIFALTQKSLIEGITMSGMKQ